jgi:hypothetical protein
MATPHYVGRRDIGRPFEAKYTGRCAGCDEPFHTGDSVVFRNDTLFKDHECPMGPSDMDADERMYARVMPRQGNASQACLRCFQIPSSNGTCGCI